MIQLNLLPDVKLHFIKAQRQKRLIMSASIITTIACGVLFAFLVLTAQVVQKKSISDLTKDIKTSSADLTETEELDKILTVQNQLNTLPGLHDQKIVSSRLFGVLQQVTPQPASISNLTIDFAANTMIIDGKADTLKTVNSFVDALKLSSITTANNPEKRSAFKNVVLTSFGRAEDATYSISLEFDPAIFVITDEAKLEVTGVQSPVDRAPEDLFQGTEGGQQ